VLKPVLKDQDFLQDVASCRTDAFDFNLWWLGQSGFLVRWRGEHLLIDPYLSDSLTKKYAATDKPHIRMTERVIVPEALSFVDVVTSSHNHTDHLDAETLIPILQTNSAVSFLIPEANREFVAQRLKLPPARFTGIDAGQTVVAGAFKFTAIPSAHETIEKDREGRCKFLGYVIEFGRWRLYHSGDTLVYPGLAEQLAGFRIDVAMLPINGAKPERRVAGNMNGAEAARLAKNAGCKLVIPCHYDMFQFNTATTDELEATARVIGQPVRILRAGERWSSRELPE
jgi:L-ascorbate metabolism protein UlaG (beta-lactamase superfamily)